MGTGLGTGTSAWERANIGVVVLVGERIGYLT